MYDWVGIFVEKSIVSVKQLSRFIIIFFCGQMCVASYSEASDKWKMCAYFELGTKYQFFNKDTIKAS